MHDKYKKKFAAGRGDDRTRRKIAAEAARRLWEKMSPAEGEATLREASAADYYAAKRKAAAVLGARVRPGDLPTDSEVRMAVLALVRSPGGGPGPVAGPDPEEGELLGPIGEHIDRFEVYRLRLAPLEKVKQDPARHPEGDALYHSLQVFDLARRERPNDEEFLTAALLHDVGKAIDLRDRARAALESLDGAISPRVAWLIRWHHQEAREAPPDPDWSGDLADLGRLDEQGRAQGVPVPTVEEALGYLRDLEAANESDDEDI